MTRSDNLIIGYKLNPPSTVSAMYSKIHKARTTEGGLGVSTGEHICSTDFQCRMFAWLLPPNGGMWCTLVQHGRQGDRDHTMLTQATLGSVGGQIFKLYVYTMYVRMSSVRV